MIANNNKGILTWIHDFLGADLKDICNNIFPDSWVTEAVMAGIACREYGFLIPRKVNAGQSFEHIVANATGDSGHGRSFWQIDDRSYPDFVNTHPLSDYRAYAIKAIECLKEKENSLINAGFIRERLGDENYEKAILSAYNCGQGNVIKALRNGKDSDSYTFDHDYGKSVMDFRYLYYDMFGSNETPEPTPETIANVQPFAEIEPKANQAIYTGDTPPDTTNPIPGESNT